MGSRMRRELVRFCAHMLVHVHLGFIWRSSLHIVRLARVAKSKPISDLQRNVTSRVRAPPRAANCHQEQSRPSVCVENGSLNLWDSGRTRAPSHGTVVARLPRLC